MTDTNSARQGGGGIIEPGWRRGHMHPVPSQRRKERMRFLQTSLPGVIIVEPDVYRDDRGFFLETYNLRKYRDGGIPSTFVQDNQLRSVYNIIRGLHAHQQHPQGKLIRVIEGEIFEVVVDIRRGSLSFLHWVAITLSARNLRQCYLPPGFAHGFCVTSPVAQIEYKCADFYDPSDEIRIRWDDPDIDIKWPLDDPILSPKDRAAAYLRDVLERLPICEPQAK
jgi:dTDP-4-dehydrorhamnose 3,5-epimerase